ncbi:MAG: membrane-bound lytic murein transglycosylase MltF [Gammaproteobacteria bacterium]|nr:membrane-bound lytic murein transglycosylase MltF [Gammaproteobacteria bacterium]
MSLYNKSLCTIDCYRDRIVEGFLIFLGVVLIALLLWFFYLTDWRHQVLDGIQERGELVAVTRNAPTTYYEDQNGRYAGIEHDLVISFADYLGVKARFILKDTVEDIFDSLDEGKADFAAAGLTKTISRQDKYLFGPSYQSVEERLVCRRNHNGIPDSVEELAGKVLVIPNGTSYVDRLEKLKREYPQLEWVEEPGADTEQLLRQVWLRKIDCTVSDSNILSINRRFYPELYPAFQLNEHDDLVWVLPDNARHLKKEMDNWLEDLSESGQLNDLIERYYGHLDGFDYVDTRKFRNRIKSTLPKYHTWFRQAAKQYDMDWMFLAAVSYQESHWNPRARSPTGVRGIMMLTLPTAKQMGVKSRLDAKSNIFAGAKYLARLRSRLPESIKEPERTWMALVAYNMGYGHLRDARNLAERLGKDPNRWIDLEQVLPLLSQKAYYTTLKHGYARGYEAVQYVGRIREYHDILLQYY